MDNVIHTQGDGQFEAEINKLFTSLPILPPVRGWWQMARRSCEQIDEVPLDMVLNAKGTLCYFRPSESEGDKFEVRCPNHFYHSGIDPNTFGMGVTLCWLQQMHIELYRAGHLDTAEIAKKLHSKLKNAAFANTPVWDGINLSILFDFID